MHPSFAIALRALCVFGAWTFFDTFHMGVDQKLRSSWGDHWGKRKRRPRPKTIMSEHFNTQIQQITNFWLSLRNFVPPQKTTFTTCPWSCWGRTKYLSTHVPDGLERLAWTGSLISAASTTSTACKRCKQRDESAEYDQTYLCHKIHPPTKRKKHKRVGAGIGVAFLACRQ